MICSRVMLFGLKQPFHSWQQACRYDLVSGSSHMQAVPPPIAAVVTRASIHEYRTVFPGDSTAYRVPSSIIEAAQHGLNPACREMGFLYWTAVAIDGHDPDAIEDTLRWRKELGAGKLLCVVGAR